MPVYSICDCSVTTEIEPLRLLRHLLRQLLERKLLASEQFIGAYRFLVNIGSIYVFRLIVYQFDIQIAFPHPTMFKLILVMRNLFGSKIHQFRCL